ncbi:HC03 family inorganic anion exchanger [Schizosaccharomyces japonicus yFS275]|uniref:HC03 family inorganic anion exchanger n=1 Tax=Schizosaccharomyces japonicus (strain yFS275 / FY16936) TaxID=402676 RepID=B6JZZ4_SCHJY|nr:HC03 family inorganic anion exchanger [Schizosaccharomyces japonicus yFS275]EEB06144.1 HC03 family inorganic anion exchanger [Schizosaccharomyces japonicus yFS275]
MALQKWTTGCRPFSGMLRDLKRRLRYYKSDWTDAWDYRVLPASINIYFANLLPELAFALDMFRKTDNNFGVNEVLLASVLGSVVFALFSAQPLCITGVTGPITVFNYTIYEIIRDRDTPYFPFMFWICFWSMIMHMFIAITNGVNYLKHITSFSCQIFGFYVAFIYLQKGIQILISQQDRGLTDLFLSVVVALLVLFFGYGCNILGKSNLFKHQIRVFLLDYGLLAVVIFFSGFQHMGKMKEVPLARLPTSKAFEPSEHRSWLVHFWRISVGDVFLAIPFAIVLTILFYFDHNVSCIMSQSPEYPVKKPSGFHWDFFLLGITTGISGLLGIPAPNGLIPQAPMHTESLCVTRVQTETEAGEKHKPMIIMDRVVEQRASNLIQGLLTLGTMTGPFLVVLRQIPQCVLAGLFWVMGFSAIEGNAITRNLLWVFGDKRLIPEDHQLNGCVKRSSPYYYTLYQLIGFGCIFAITQIPKASIGFPVVLMILIPFRKYFMEKWFVKEDLELLDSPVGEMIYS